MDQLGTGAFLGVSKANYHLSGIMLSETVYTSRVSEEWHHHANPHCSLILEGGNLEHRRHRQQEALPGQLLRYAAGEVHRNLHTLHPSRNLNLELEPTFFKTYDLPEMTWETIAEHDLQLAVLKLYHACSMEEDTLGHTSLLSLWGRPGRPGKGLPAWAIRIRELLQDQWDTPFTLASLSAQAGVHPVTVSRYFPQYFHCTLGEYLRKIKVAQSLALVRNKENSLTDIAFQCGFYDQSHFIRSFRQYTGYRPGAFRKL